eukprot:2148436-Lingulodinium_polyedra.AAC.1
MHKVLSNMTLDEDWDVEFNVVDTLDGEVVVDFVPGVFRAWPSHITEQLWRTTPARRPRNLPLRRALPPSPAGQELALQDGPPGGHRQ